MDPFVAEIRIFPFGFAPQGWAACDGQLMPIAQNTALFSLLGTSYGGDGKSTYALPDLGGRAAIHQGQAPGLSSYDLGQTGGTETVQLLQSELPSHGHTLGGDSFDPADTNVPSPNASYALSTGGTLYQSTPDSALSDNALAPAGGGQPHNNLQPYLTLNFNIALLGVFPQRP
jgi:microcystin-dependent protein